MRHAIRLGVLAFFLAALPASAQIVVTTTADNLDAEDGECTLREAIINANLDADLTDGDCAAGNGADVITLPAGTYTLTFGSAFEDDALGGDLDVHDDLTINGAGEATTIIDGDDNDRVLHVTLPQTQPGKRLAAALTLNDLTIRNGRVPSNEEDAGQTGPFSRDGGGLLNEGGTLTLNNVTLTENRAGDDFFFGGNGGGLANMPGEDGLPGPATLTNVTLTNNTSGDGFIASGGFGGGLFNACGVMTLTGATITGNMTGYGGSGGNGGGGANLGGDVTITGSVINENATASGGGSGDSFGGFGGGFSNGGGFCGVIQKNAPPDPGTLTIEDSEVRDNQTGDGAATGGFGGGLYNGDGPPNNQPLGQAAKSYRVFTTGAARNPGTLTVTDTEITGNETGDLETEDPEKRIPGRFGGGGGGLANDGGTAILTRVLVQDNETGDGGAFFQEIGGPGGGIFSGAVCAFFCDEEEANAQAPAASLEIYDSLVDDNRTGGGSIGGPGGGLFQGSVEPGFFNKQPASRPPHFGFVTGTTFSNNRAGDGDGIGGPGGGIAHSEGDLLLTNTTVSGNRAGDGGFLAGSGGGIITGSEEGGGPPTLSPAFLALNNVTITDNETGDAQNPDGEAGGGGIASFDGGDLKRLAPPTVHNTLIAGNRLGGPDQEGPDCLGVFESEGYNLIGIGDGCFGFDEAPTASAGKGALAEGDKVGTADDPLDPVLGPLADNGGPTPTHLLLPGSPAIDMGNPGTPNGDGTCEPVDQRDVDRPIDGDGDGDPVCDIGAVEIEPIDADLAVEKTVDEEAPDLGATVTFTVTLTNNGPAASTGSTVTDVLPTGLVYVSHTTSQGTYAPASGVWSLGALAAGETATLEITARVDTLDPVTNTATITRANQPDPNGDNDTASVSLTAIAADLELTKEETSFTRHDDGSVSATFTLLLVNNGPNDATGVEVTDSMEEGLQYVSHAASQGTYAPAEGVWTVGDLGNGDTATLTLTVFAADTGENGLLNTAEVTASDQVDPDSTPANNEAGEDDFDGDLVGRPPAGRPDLRADLSLAKTASDESPAVGSQITYTLTLENTGPNPTAGVQVTDVLPAGVAFAGAAASQGTYDPGTGVWTVGPLGNGKQVTLEITVTVEDAGTIVNTAEVTRSNVFDPDSRPGNGEAGEDDQATATITAQAPQLRTSGLPDRLALGTNYPNPFNPETAIPVALPEAAHVRLVVYDLLGRPVRVLVDEPMEAGRHTIPFHAGPLPTGVYLVRLEAAGASHTRRITLMK